MKLFQRFRDREVQRRLPHVLIGGIGAPNHADASAGLIAADRMADENWPSEIQVLDLGEGGDRLAESLRRAAPPFERLILLTSTARGRAPGRLYSYRWSRPSDVSAEDHHEIDRLLSSLSDEGILPDEVILVELEPAGDTTEGALSDRALRLLPELTRRAQREALAPPKRPPVAGTRSTAAP